MEDGRVTQSGNYEELLTAGTAFEQLVNAHKNAITALDISNNEEEEAQKVDHIQPEVSHRSKEKSEEETSMKGLHGGQLTEEEEMEVGDVGWKPFWDYLLVSKGSPLMFFGFLAQCGFVALQAASTYWLALGIEIPKISNGMLIGVYAGISSLSAVFVYLRSILVACLGLKASKAFFAGFTSSIFNAPMLFFDSTPVGRILTRVRSSSSFFWMMLENHDFLVVPTEVRYIISSIYSRTFYLYSYLAGILGFDCFRFRYTLLHYLCNGSCY